MEAMTSEREAFEKWMGRVHPSFPLSYHQGAYVLSSVRDLWNAFSAGRAHLAQPAQAVDVGAIQEVAGRLMDGNPYGMSRGVCRSLADRLTRALSGEKAGPVGDGKARAFALHAAVGAIYFADGSDYLSALWEVVRELAPELVDELAVDPSAVWHRTMAATDRFTLPASPTPDKEGEG